MDKIHYSTHSAITIATNTFINVPVILRINDVNIIELVKDEKLGFTSLLAIYDSEGEEIAKVKGTRIYATNEGKSKGLKIEQHADTWVGKLGEQILFENRVERGELFKMQAELYSPQGYLFKATDHDGVLTNSDGLKVGAISFKECTFRDLPVGINL